MNPRMWGRLRYCLGRRRSADGLAAPPLPNPANFSLLPTALKEVPFLCEFSDANLETPYPSIDAYENREQAIEAAERRAESRGIFPKSEAEKVWEKKQKMAS
jgi:hypothetical protein